jgi:hypothetical protein
MKSRQEIMAYLNEKIQSYREYTPVMRKKDGGDDPLFNGYLDGYEAAMRQVKRAMPGKKVKEILAYVDRKSIDADVEADDAGCTYEGGFLGGSCDALVDLQYWILTGVRDYSQKIPLECA